MKRKRFTKTEVEALLGKRVRARVDLGDVLAGTPGQVYDRQAAGWEEGYYDVIVRFEPSLTIKPVLKWLSKSDYTYQVEEV
jgi:hypothetical protein